MIAFLDSTGGGNFSMGSTGFSPKSTFHMNEAFKTVSQSPHAKS